MTVLADSLTTTGGTATTTDDYGYDDSNQLITDNSTDYAFDANGNPNPTGTTVGTDNEVQSDSNWDYTYDNAGNLIQKTGVGSNSEVWVYGYDNANELIAVHGYNDSTISSGTSSGLC